MLVITVPLGQYVDIGNVRVHCVRANARGARIGIECSRDTIIVRSDAKNKLPRKEEEKK